MAWIPDPGDHRPEDHERIQARFEQLDPELIAARTRLTAARTALFGDTNTVAA